MDIRHIAIACLCQRLHTTTIGLPRARAECFRFLTLVTHCVHCGEAYGIELTEEQINVVPMALPPMTGRR